jgi:hypothetical protein
MRGHGQPVGTGPDDHNLLVGLAQLVSRVVGAGAVEVA